MTDQQIMDKIDEAMKIGRKDAYVDIFLIVSEMRINDNNENLNKLLNLLHDRVLKAGIYEMSGYMRGNEND